jgi:hypothetical protein
MELAEQQVEAAEAQDNNPALAILKAWCVSHYGRCEELEYMLCPFCSSQISPIWNVLFTTHNEKGQTLQTPTIELKSNLRYDPRLRGHDSVTVKLV